MTHWEDMQNARRQFIEAMRKRGLVLGPHEDLIADGHIHRCDVADKPGSHGKGDGSYCFFENGSIPAGWFLNWTDGRKPESWHYQGGRRITTSERNALARLAKQKRKEFAEHRRKINMAARKKAVRLWRDAEPAPDDHPYCRRKKVKPHGLRMLNAGDQPLLVPMYDEQGKLQNLHFIHANRNKHPNKHGLKDGKVADAHYWIATPKQADNANTICICEGWSTGESIYQATGYAVIIAFGSNLLPVAEWVRTRYPEARLIICADDDWKTTDNEGRPINPGIAAAKKAADAVGGFVAVPKFGADRRERETDFNDMMIAAGSDAVQRVIDDAAATSNIEVVAGVSDDQRPKHKRPVIEVAGGQIARIVDDIQAALLAARMRIFVRGDMLVVPVTVERAAAHNRTTLVTVFKALTEPKLAYMLNKHAAEFVHYDGRSNKLVSIDPPAKATNALLALGQWQFPEVLGIVSAPTLRPDGSILSKFGYDPATKLWCNSKVNLPAIPNRPTRAQAEAALQMLKKLLEEFPFVSEVNRAVALAAISTAVLRGGFDRAPLFAVLAHEIGTGKSYLVNVIATIVTGRDCPVITGSKSSEEMEKRLGALLLEGTTLTSLDNLSRDIEGDLLSQIITQDFIKTRVLGKSEMPECVWSGTLFATGNNVRVAGDMVRRTMVCRLDAGVERPEQRKFKFDAKQRALQKRGEIIAAVLTIVRAYLAAGRPQAKEATPLAGFERWSKLVREPLRWLGEQDPVNCMEQARVLDPERAAARELIGYWKQRFGIDAVITAAKLAEKANTPGSSRPDRYRYPQLRALLVAQAGSRSGDRIDVSRLGLWLQRIHGRVFDGFRIERQETRKGQANNYVLKAIKPGRQ